MKRVGLVLFLAVSLLGAVGAWYWYISRLKSVPAYGGSNLSVRLADTVHYQQGDPRWGKQPLGKLDNETLATSGCTVTSVAMAMTNLGHPIDPGQLNMALIADGGFTQNGWLMWSAIPRLSNAALRVDVHDTPSLDRLDACLKRGDYPIVKFMIAGFIPHWVQIVGKHEGTYYMRDPSIEAPEAKPLTDRTDVILSVRCVGRAVNMSDAVRQAVPR